LITAAAVWLAQDLLQVLTMGIMLVPEFFLLTVAYGIVSGSLSQERISMWIWFSFFGGILWDFRWAALPGMSGLVNVCAVMVVYMVWNRTPLTGRGTFLFAVLGTGIHFMSGIAHYLAWADSSAAAERMFLIQQLLGVPVLALLCMIYAFRKADVHV
jgi:hypothetical protein